MTSEELFLGLKGAGFIGESQFDGDIHQPNYKIKNELAVYIGTVLETYGFNRTEEPSCHFPTLTFTTFKLGKMEVSHRSLKERDTKCFTFKELD